jgi:VWFA-related protein
MLSLLPAQETIRVDTRLILLNVYAEDKDGKPVTDLKPEDLVIYDGKKQEEIRIFTRQADGITPSAAPLPPGTYTNRIDAEGGAPVAVTAVVIDQLNTPWQKQHYNRDLILKMLQQIDPRHRVALYVLGTELRVLHDFTSDTESLIATLRRIGVAHNTAGNRPDQAAETGQTAPVIGVISDGGGDKGEGGAAERAAEQAARRAAFEQLLSETESTNAIMDAQRRAWITLGAMESVAYRMARIPGRKNLVWVSSGFPTHFFEYLNSPQGRNRPAHMLREFERTSRALVNSGVSVYSVQGGDSGGIAVDVTQQNAISSRAVRRWEMNAWNSMLEISGLTGGRAFGNIHQFGDAMARAAADSRLSYTVGYYPSHDKWDGSFREVKLKAARPGLRGTGPATLRLPRASSRRTNGGPPWRMPSGVLSMPPRSPSTFA